MLHCGDGSPAVCILYFLKNFKLAFCQCSYIKHYHLTASLPSPQCNRAQSQMQLQSHAYTHAGGSLHGRHAAPRPVISQHRTVQAHSTRREALLSGLLASGPLIVASEHANAAVQPTARVPFCGVVDQVPNWAYTAPWLEDLVSFAGGNTWYRYVNYVPPKTSGLLGRLQRAYSPVADDKLPVLVIPGGPGLPCSYLEPIELMAGAGRQVILYDQVGCGNTFLASNNTCPPVDQLTPELFLQQIDALRDALKLDQVHLYGQGIGGMLALSYAAAKQGSAGGIVSVTAASTPSSYSQLIADRRAALKALGPETEEALLAAEESTAEGTTTAGVAAAQQQYMRQYISRFPAATASQPPGCARTALQQRSKPVFEALAGGKCFAVAGSLAEWNVQGVAAGLQDTPVLVTRGEFDEVSQSSAQQLVDALGRAQLVSFAGSGSYQHFDVWEPHLTKVEVHLCVAEGSPVPKTA